MTMNLVPDSTGTRNLGTSTKKWKDAYFSGTVNCQSFNPVDPVTNVSVTAANVTNTIAGNITATDQQAVNAYFDGRIGAETGTKNILINPEMSVWQRGITFTTTAGAAKKYTIDHWWATSTGGSMTVDRSIITDLTGFGYGLKLTGGSGLTSNIVGQYNEAHRCRNLVGKKLTLSFWVRASAVTNITIENCVPSSTADDFSSRTITAVGSITGITSSWQRKSITFDAPTGVARGLGILIVPDALSSGGTLEITGVQLEEGSKMTDFEYVEILKLMGLCFRFYQTSECGMSYKAYTVGDAEFQILSLREIMRTLPTISIVRAPTSKVNCTVSYGTMETDADRIYLSVTATATGTVSFSGCILGFESEL